jgi:hypothetical protein
VNVSMIEAKPMDMSCRFHKSETKRDDVRWV